MDYRGLDFGTGIGNLSNVLEQGYRDRLALQRENDNQNRQMVQAEMQDRRARELKAQEFQQQNARDLQKFGYDKQLAQIAASGKPGASESGLKPKEVSQLRRDALKSKEAQGSQAILKLDKALDQYSNLVDQYGYQPTGVDRSKIDSAYADLTIKYKEAAALGALTGPDMEILAKAIQPAGGFKSMVGGSLFTGGIEGVKQGIGQIKNNLRADSKINIDALRQAYPEPVARDLLNQLELKQQPSGPAWLGQIPNPKARSFAEKMLSSGKSEAEVLSFIKSKLGK